MKSSMDVSGFPRRDFTQEFLAWRGIEEACPHCTGTGYIVYGSTSTYWGGIGGAAMTKGVCNKCWGSGEKNYAWPSHKEFFIMKRATAKK
jgi:hypothetical protein